MVELREILSHPVDRGLLWAVLGGGVVTAVVGLVVGLLFAFGILPPGASSSIGTSVEVSISPDKPAQLVSPLRDVTVDVPAGSVNGPVQLNYQRVPLTKNLQMPLGYVATEKVFELSVTSGDGAAYTSFPFNAPILLTVTLSVEDAALAGGVASNVVIQHFGDRGKQWWISLPTRVDFRSSTAFAQVDSLSVFALTIRGPSTPSPTTTTQATETAISTITPPALQPATTAPETPSPAPSFKLMITTIPDKGGAVTGAGAYPAGSSVPVTARPKQGWAFAGWSGDCTGVASCVLIMDSDKTVTARFTQSLHNLSVIKVGQGTVSMNPPGGTHLEGALVRASAAPSPGWTFEGWSGACVGSETCVITMTGDKKITATFSQVLHNLSVVRVGMGQVVLVPPGGTHVNGTVVTATAAAAAGWRFEGWFGPCSGTGVCTVRMTSGQTITARFAKILITLKVTNAGKGTVRLDPPGGTYDRVVVVNATPVPSPGWKFDGWSGACTDAGPCVITLDSNRRLTATFTEVQHTLTVNTVGGGTVSLNPDGGAYPFGTIVTGEAVPSPGWEFAGWSGVCAGTDACVVTMDSGQSITATFVRSIRLPLTRLPDRILFASDRDGNWEIYVMEADGANQINLTNDPFSDLEPAWSPDRERIAYNHAGDIYVMDADGDNKTRLTTDGSDDLMPAWSPDGSKIVFASKRDGNHEIYVMNADGSQKVRLTNSSGQDEVPSWSPDGKKIAFASDRDENFEIYVMDADGSNVTNLTLNLAFDYQPDWSPDGTKIAFMTNGRGAYGGDNSEIYVMNADGSKPVNLTNHGHFDADPTWSPDGTKIAFESHRITNIQEVWVMNADGSNPVNLTNGATGDLLPDW